MSKITGSSSTKIYEWINGTNGRKGLIKYGYIKKSREASGYVANMNALLSIIKNEIDISKEEGKILAKILNSRGFRDFFKREIINNIEFPTDIRSFTGIDYIFEIISLISGIALAAKVHSEWIGNISVEEVIDDLLWIEEVDSYYFSNNFHLLTNDTLRELAKMSEYGYWTGHSLYIGWSNHFLGISMGIEACRRLFKDNEKVLKELDNNEKITEIMKEILREWREHLKSELLKST
ncbi:MAG: hypothetical protein JSV56_11870 [Methanomassiliicoccales archaeon]|nr:MAG: hypothetical protein JSV56_11870 [Methanomassiliicoccales archaeon]